MIEVSSAKNRRRFKTWVAVATTTAILLILNYVGLANGIKNFFFNVSEPLQKFLWEKGGEANNFFEKIFNSASLQENSDSLEKENQTLRALVFQLRQVQVENEQLRTALGLELNKDFKLSLAEIIAKDPLADTLLINKGAIDGVRAEMAVVTPQKILLGQIGEVYDNFSQVLLTSNPGLSLSAKTVSNTPEEPETTGLSRGQGNLKIVLDLVTQDKKMMSGQAVVTTNLGGKIPAGLLIGQVTNVNTSDVKPFQSAKIQAAFGLDKLDSVFIITDF